MEEKSPTKKKKKSKTNWPATIGITLVLMVAAIAVCVTLSMQGKTKVTDNTAGPETSEALTCEVEGVVYPFFKYDESEKKTTKINAIFQDGVMSTISLIYSLYYNNSEQIVKSEAENHAALNLKMQNEGLGPDAFDANYAKLKDRLKLSLYAEAKKLNINTVKYFELDWVESGKYNMATVQANYEDRGFKCVAKDE